MGFILSPRSSRLRQWLFQVHLWTGIAAGLVLLVLGLSGAALVYSPELEIGPLWSAGPEPGRLPVDEIAARAMRGRETFQLQDIRFDVDGNATVLHLQTLTGVKGAGGDLLLRVNPSTGEVLKTIDRRSGGWSWLREFHHNLLAGRTGRVVNGIVGILMLALCLTGLVVWWPGPALWRKRLVIGRAKGWKRFNWDLHGVTGFWSAAVLAFFSFSAVQFAFPHAVENIVRFVTLTGRPPAKPKVKSERSGEAASIESLLGAARAAMPDGRIGFIKLPRNPNEPVEVRLKTAFDGRHDGNSKVLLDPNSASVLQVQRFDELSLGNQALSSMGQIHMARFMTPGWASVAIRSVWLIAGLAPGLLFLTGFLMWWSRVLGKRPANISKKAIRPATLLRRTGGSAARTETAFAQTARQASVRAGSASPKSAP